MTKIALTHTDLRLHFMTTHALTQTHRFTPAFYDHVLYAVHHASSRLTMMFKPHTMPRGAPVGQHENQQSQHQIV